MNVALMFTEVTIINDIVLKCTIKTNSCIILLFSRYINIEIIYMLHNFNVIRILNKIFINKSLRSITYSFYYMCKFNHTHTHIRANVF